MTKQPDETPFGKRLLELFEGVQKQEIAEHLGAKSPSTITEYLTGKSFPKPDRLKKISEITKCSLHWLITGEGDKYINERRVLDFRNNSDFNTIVINEEVRQVIENLSKQEYRNTEELVDELLIEALSIRGEIDNTRRAILIYEEFGEHSEKLVPIKVLGTIAAGKPIEAIAEQYADTVWVDEALVIDERTYALRVKGDSMIEEGILNGDLIICHKSPNAFNGQKVVALIDNDYATVKTFYKSGNYIRLTPANNFYKPMLLHASRVVVQGIVTAIQRRV